MEDEKQLNSVMNYMTGVKLNLMSDELNSFVNN